MAETVPGGRYLVNGVLVDADGRPVVEPEPKKPEPTTEPKKPEPEPKKA